jgi:hypothetical protein
MQFTLTEMTNTTKIRKRIYCSAQVSLPINKNILILYATDIRHLH